MPRSPDDLRSNLRGIIGFGVTPFNDNLEVYTEELRRNAAHLAEHCDVVVPLGNNGEIYSLSLEEQERVGRMVVEEVGRRKPVVVGVGFSLPAATELARAAEAYGADGVLALPPHMTNASDDGLFEYYRAVASATRLGVLLFQTPALNFSVPLLRRLGQIPNIVGMKDEHGDMKQFVRQLAAMGEQMELLCGVGEILAPSYFALGVKAFTSGIVNFMPQTCHRILEHLRKRETEAAAQIVARDALPIYDLRGRRPGYTTVVIKEAMNLCGFKAGSVRPPLSPLTEQDRAELRSILDHLGLLKK